MSRVLVVLLGILIVVGALWGAAALHFAARGPAWLPNTLAIIFGVAMLACLVLLRRPAAPAVAACLFAAVLIWWLSLRPSNTRDWEPEYALTPSVQRDGDHIAFENIRNAVYPSADSIKLAYYNAAFDLNQLNEVDLITSYWAGEAIAHVFLSFGFSGGQHLAISVETRRELHEPYDAIAGFFRRYEIIYVVADERDLIGARTDTRGERVFLYRLRATPGEIRALFLSYVDRIQSLSKTPEFYNTLTNNCTTNVISRANSAAREVPLSWKVLLSGYADQFAYDIGRIDSNLPFAEVKRASRIQRPPGAGIGADFSADIRQSHPD
jgi:Domain of unknown function (DUF4105)